LGFRCLLLWLCGVVLLEDTLGILERNWLDEFWCVCEDVEGKSLDELGEREFLRRWERSNAGYGSQSGSEERGTHD
jgi:hypothetical protein